MNLNKIDVNLFYMAGLLGEDKKIICLVSGRNFENLKALLKKNNIHIMNEY